jgi:hypothetical protein
VHCGLVDEANLWIKGGIIAHLDRERRGVANAKGAVTLRSSERRGKQDAAQCVADFNSNTCFHFSSDSGGWIEYDFGNHRLRPTACAIRVCNCNRNYSSRLVHLVIETSIDRSDWIQVASEQLLVVSQRHQYGYQPNQFASQQIFSGASMNFRIYQTEECRFIRLRQAAIEPQRGDNVGEPERGYSVAEPQGCYIVAEIEGAHSVGNNIGLSAFEIFGALFGP